MTDRELMQQALSVLCNNVQPRDGVRDNRHLTPKSHVEIHQQTIDALRDRLAQPEQGPVAWYDKHGMVTHDPFEGVTPLYKSPRQWVGLTDREIDELWISHHDSFGNPLSATGYERAIEAKLKEKTNDNKR